MIFGLCNFIILLHCVSMYKRFVSKYFCKVLLFNISFCFIVTCIQGLFKVFENDINIVSNMKIDNLLNSSRLFTQARSKKTSPQYCS